MAFPSYPPYQGYQPYYPQPVPDQLAQLRQQQMMQNQQQMPVQAPPSPPGNGILWVQGEEGAKAYLTAPGASVMLMDSEKNTFYIKSSDQSGMPLPLRIFDYTERTAAQKQPVQAVQQQAVEYVTRKEFEALEAKIAGLTVKEPAKAKKISVKEEAENG